MWNIKVKFPWNKEEQNLLDVVSTGFTLPDQCESPQLKPSFETYLKSLKPRTPEESFAVQALKEMCHTNAEYQLAPGNPICYVVYCFDGKDKDWYIRFFAKMLSPFKPLWNNCNNQDFLRRLGIRFATKREDVVGLNVRGVLVSYKWIGFLTGKVTLHGYTLEANTLKDWHSNMAYFEQRMQARFLDNYFIWMGSEECAAFEGANAQPRIIDLDEYIRQETTN